MIDKYTIDRINNAAQIYDVVSDFVTLRKRGVNYVGLCPFHDDTSPSFYVSPSKNICKCFACGEGGTPAHFIMKHEQLSYYEALRYLAKKYNIEIKERELSDEEKQRNSDRDSMFVVNDWAQKFFTSQLNDTEEGRSVGLPYFIERGFRDDTIKKFQLGFAPSKRDSLYKSALKEGFKEDYLVKTGLVVKHDDGKASDRYWGRVIFPVHTLSGKIVAFGGRVLAKKDKIAKYVNSPESEIYHKSNELYGIYFAKQAIVKADKCYLVEGYTDVIQMHQTGVENVVASSGTALTHNQIRLIHRFTNNITVLYDGDAAGIKAAIRGIDMLLEEGMNIKVVLLPDGEDPDSFAKSHNSFDFQMFMKEHEVDFIQFKIELLKQDVGNDPKKRAELINNIMESIAVIPDNITRSVYIKECSSRLEIHELDLIEQVRKIRERRAQMSNEERRREAERINAEIEKISENKHDTGTEIDAEEKSTSVIVENRQPDTQNKIADIPSPLKKYETSLIQYIIRYGERSLFSGDGEDDASTVDIKLAEYVNSELNEDNISFRTPLYREIMEEALAHCRDEGFVAERYFVSHINMEISKLATDMSINKYQLSKIFEERETIFKGASLSEAELKAKEEAYKEDKERKSLEQWIVSDILSLKNAYVQYRLNELDKNIKNCQADEEKMLELMKEKMRLDDLKRRLSKALGDRIVIGI